MIIYQHLKHIYKHNCSSRCIINMLWKAQMPCFIEIVVSHAITVPRNWSLVKETKGNKQANQHAHNTRSGRQ